jgi:hypothetical protein
MSGIGTDRQHRFPVVRSSPLPKFHRRDEASSGLPQSCRLPHHPRNDPIHGCCWSRIPLPRTVRYCAFYRIPARTLGQEERVCVRLGTYDHHWYDLRPRRCEERVWTGFERIKTSALELDYRLGNMVGHHDRHLGHRIHSRQVSRISVHLGYGADIQCNPKYGRLL